MGDSLLTHMRQHGSLSLSSLRLVGLDCLHALALIHEAGLVHTDIRLTMYC